MSASAVGRTAGKTLGVFVHVISEPIVGDHHRREPDALRFRGVDVTAGEQNFRGARHSDEAREERS